MTETTRVRDKLSRVAALFLAAVLAFGVVGSAQAQPPQPPAAAATYGSIETIPNPAVIDTRPLRAKSLEIRELFADRVLQCGLVDDVIDTLTRTGAVTTINDLNTSFAVGAGGFNGSTTVAFVFTAIDSGPNAATAGDIRVLLDSLGYVLSQGSGFLLDADNPAGFDFPGNYVVLDFATPPTLQDSAELFETVGRIDPALFSTSSSGYTQYGRSYLSLQSAVPEAQFIAGYVQAAAEYGVTYTPVVNGVPGLFRGGAAFPGNNWTTNPAGQQYLARIPAPAHQELGTIRSFHLSTVERALAIVADGDRHRDPQERVIRRGLSQLPCRSGGRR